MHYRRPGAKARDSRRRQVRASDHQAHMKVAQVIEVEPHFMQPLNARRYTDLPWEVIQKGSTAG